MGCLVPDLESICIHCPIEWEVEILSERDFNIVIAARKALYNNSVSIDAAKEKYFLEQNDVDAISACLEIKKEE